MPSRSGASLLNSGRPHVITSYSIHYTKLYDAIKTPRGEVSWKYFLPFSILMGAFVYAFGTRIGGPSGDSIVGDTGDGDTADGVV